MSIRTLCTGQAPRRVAVQDVEPHRQMWQTRRTLFPWQVASLPTKIIGNCLVLLYQDCSVGESKVEAHLVVSIHTVADTQDALGRPDAGEEDGHRSKEADRKGEAKEADLARQRGQRTRLQAEAMANALKVGLAGGLLEDGFPDFSRFWFCPLYVGARSIPGICGAQAIVGAHATKC